MSTSTSDSKSQERRSVRFWSIFILALMAINLLVALVAILIAVGDPSFKPVPSYGENAVDWETWKKLQAKSDSLGWTASLNRNPARKEVLVSIIDRVGNPVSGMSGTLRAYHFTRAGESVTVPVVESKTEPGRYKADIDVSKDGRWQVTLRLMRGEDEVFFWDHDVEWYR
jgi:nitrogen fixation protein FixH